MFYRNSQGNIINLDNVREIVRRGNSAVYDIQKDKVDAFADENYKVLEWLHDPKTFNEFMGWLWERIEMEIPYCSYEEFASLRAISDKPKYDPKKIEDNRNFLKEVAKKLEEVAEEAENEDA
jgi:hypothetical protein